MTTDHASLDQRLRALEDREAIREIIAQYGPRADAGDAKGVADLWTEDGCYAISGFGVAEGQEAIAGFITSDSHRQLMEEGCAHVLGPVTIVIDHDVATARGHSVVFRWTGSGFEAARVAANRWQLSRTPSGWRVTRRDNALLTGEQAARALLALPPIRGA